MFVAPAYKITSINLSWRLRAAGMTLMELVVAMGVSALVTVMIIMLASSTGRSFAEMVNYVDLDHYNRVALDIMTRDLRQVKFLQSFHSNSVVFMDKDDLPLEYTYSSGQRTLTRLKNGDNRIILDNCDALEFSIFQRTPISNRFDLYAISAVDNCKVVRVSWNCSRMLFGRKLNTEQAQAARIVIRNKKEI
jgi:Tfp pilus assembly protein PilW